VPIIACDDVVLPRISSIHMNGCPRGRVRRIRPLRKNVELAGCHPDAAAAGHDIFNKLNPSREPQGALC
jgi:hypothetical protein